MILINNLNDISILFRKKYAKTNDMTRPFSSPLHMHTYACRKVVSKEYAKDDLNDMSYLLSYTGKTSYGIMSCGTRFFLSSLRATISENAGILLCLGYKLKWTLYS